MRSGRPALTVAEACSAERVADLAHALRSRRPALVAWWDSLDVGTRDQLEAAGIDACARAARGRGGVSFVKGGPEVAAARVLLFVIFSMKQRGRFQFCPHLEGYRFIRRPVVGVVDLGHRIAYCERCAEWAMAALRGTPEDDGRCDFCQRGTTEFWEFTIPLDGPIVHGDLCGACAREVVRWQHEEEEP